MDQQDITVYKSLEMKCLFSWNSKKVKDEKEDEEGERVAKGKKLDEFVSRNFRIPAWSLSK